MTNCANRAYTLEILPPFIFDQTFNNPTAVEIQIPKNVWVDRYLHKKDLPTQEDLLGKHDVKIYRPPSQVIFGKVIIDEDQC